MKMRSRKRPSSPAWKARLHRHRLECRQCEIVCERVVYPYQCLRSGCSAVYAYVEGGTTFFGCVHKVFLAELDLSAFKIRSARRGGEDPYGSLRVSGPPRPQCPIAIEQAYEKRAAGSTCSNPTFFHQPAGPAAERIRLAERTDRPPSGGAATD